MWVIRDWLSSSDIEIPLFAERQAPRFLSVYEAVTVQRRPARTNLIREYAAERCTVLQSSTETCARADDLAAWQRNTCAQKICGTAARAVASTRSTRCGKVGRVRLGPAHATQ